MGIDVCLGAGPLYMETDVFWIYLWVFAEREISKSKLAAEARSAATRKGHQTRADAIDEKVAIYVQWYERMDVNSDECKYRVNGTLPPSVQYNQLFLHTGFKMQQLLGDSNPVARSRPGSDRQQRTTEAASSSLIEYARPRRNNQSSYETWHDKEYGIVWEMAEQDRDFALGRRGL